MPYIKRNENGQIVAVFQEKNPHVSEYISSEHPELLRFLRDNDIPIESIKWQLTETDLSFIRAIEDLIDVLINKNLINITDLPPQVVEKMQFRKHMRNQLHWFDEVIIDVSSENSELFTASTTSNSAEHTQPTMTNEHLTRTGKNS